MIDRNKHFPVRHFGGHWSIGHWPRLEAVIRYIRSLILLNSPASIVRAYLVSEGLGSYPSSGAEWPIFVSHLPDGTGLDNAICVYDTSPYQHGELSDGQSVEHKGVMLRVRAENYSTARGKLKGLYDTLEHTQDQTLTLGVNIYEIVTTVYQYSQSVGIDTQRRFAYVMGWFINLYRMVRV